MNETVCKLPVPMAISLSNSRVELQFVSEGINPNGEKKEFVMIEDKDSLDIVLIRREDWSRIAAFFRDLNEVMEEEIKRSTSI